MRLKSALRRGVAAAVIAGIVVSSGIPAYAARWDIANGDITVKAGDAEGKNKVSQGETIDKDDTNTVITGKSDKNTVTIEAKDKDDKVEVTLKDLNIDASSRVNPSATTLNDTSYAAVNVTGKGDTNIELDGDNELKSGRYRAGLEHNQTADSEGNVTSGKLTIQDDNDKAGSLTATGGIQNGAGIGAVSVDRQPAARDDCGDAGKAKPCRICSGGGSGGHGDAAAQVGTECAQPESCLLYNGVPKPDPDDAVL